MVFFKINNQPTSPPKEVNVSYEILDKTERTLNGTMVVDIIGKKKKVEINWNYLSKEDMVIINDEISAASFLDISYINNSTGELDNLTVKVKDFNYSTGYDWVHDKVIWKNVTLSVMEK